MEKLYVVDGTGYLFRSYFAIRQMTNSQGQSTNGLYGFIRSIQKLRQDFLPRYLVLVFDAPNNKKTRLEIYPDYKANRSPPPEDLYPQIKWAQDFCMLSGIPVLSIPNVEADDTMGSIAKWAEKNDTEVFLCSSDKDLCQLVSDKIVILNTYKNNLILTSKDVEETFGIPPSLFIDYLSITGDASDNIPGMQGFGPKTAATLLQKFGSLDDLLSNPEKVSGKKKQKTLKEQAELARISKRLVTLNTSLDIPKTPSFFKLKEGDPLALKNFYKSNDFHSLVKEMEKHSTENDKENREQISYQLVDNEKSLNELIVSLKAAKEVCFDTETTHIHPFKAQLVGLGFCIEERKACYVPTNGKLGLDVVLKALKPIFESPHIHFYGHNVKYDLHILNRYKIKVHSLCFDTILASYLLNSHDHRHSLDHLAIKYFGKTKISIKSLIGSGKKEISMEQVPIDDVKNYCCEDVDYTYRLKGILEKELEERKLSHLMLNIELPLLLVLQKMEKKGIFICTKVLKKMSEEFTGYIATLEKEILNLAGEPFNINSPKQLSAILFDKLKIPPSKKKNTGYSTSADVLESLEQKYPIARKILAYRSLEKLRSTYIDSLPNEVLPLTGRIHCSFKQSVAATGRLSCKNPNLQNIPVRTKEGRKIRESFLPENSSWSFLSADYSQIELRLLAHLSDDPKLLSAFQNGEDIHTFTASLIFSLPQNQISKQMRYQAKAVNFGIIYGQQAFGLSKELGISLKEASQFIDLYFQRYRHVRDYMEYCKEKTRKTGKATTITGRERLIPDINSKNRAIRSAAERLAINTPLQGTAADLIKLAMLRADKTIKDEKKLGYMILQIHDELIFEVPDFELLDFAPLIENAMENVFSLKVPLIVNIGIGKNWKDC